MKTYTAADMLRKIDAGDIHATDILRNCLRWVACNHPAAPVIIDRTYRPAWDSEDGGTIQDPTVSVWTDADPSDWPNLYYVCDGVGSYGGSVTMRMSDGAIVATDEINGVVLDVETGEVQS